MLTEIFLATTNRGKAKEIEDALSPYPIKIVTASYPEVEETGDTFEENAHQKAKACGVFSGLPTLADDSGLCINALKGAPGVFSSRWRGDQDTYEAAFERIKGALDQSRAEDQSAFFMCVLAYYDPRTGFSKTFEGRIDGAITFPPRGHNSFGYDPIFIPKGSSKTFAEMTLLEKGSYSHRGKALAQFMEWFSLHQ
jgi:XTP/dITP diphosphohydrolase